LFYIIFNHLDLVIGCYVAVMPAKGTRRTAIRRPWADEERDAVHSYFARHFAERTLPGKNDIEQCISTHDCLANRSWRNIKDFIRNSQTKLSC